MSEATAVFVHEAAPSEERSRTSRKSRVQGAGAGELRRGKRFGEQRSEAQQRQHLGTGPPRRRGDACALPES